MPFLRDPVPQFRDPRARAYLERTLQQLDDWAERTTDAVNELIRLKGIEGIEIRQRWDDTDDTVATPAAAGFIKGNNAVPAAITQFSMSKTDEFGRLWFREGTIPTTTGFFEVNDLSRATIMRYTITAPVTVRADDLLIDVVNTEVAGSNPMQDDEVEVSFWPADLPATRTSL